MNHKNLNILAILMVAGLLLSACAQKSASAAKTAPVKVDPIEGSSLKRLTLIPEAAKRLDIQTAPVREEPFVRMRQVGGDVVQDSTARGTTQGAQVLVRVSLSPSELKAVRGDEPVLVFPLAATSEMKNVDGKQPAAAPALGLKARPVKLSTSADSPNDVDTTLYYQFDSENHGLAPRQRVLVQLTLAGNGAPRKAIPYSAVIYDKNGNTWTFVSTESLVYFRQPVEIDYIEGDLAILAKGPAAGTAVVTVGAAELYGAEVGVGK